MGSGVNTYRPSSLVAAVWGAAVAWLTMVTRARETFAPVLSVTVPRIVPVSTCAFAGSTQSRNANHASNMRFRTMDLLVFISVPPALGEFLWPAPNTKTPGILVHRQCTVYVPGAWWRTIETRSGNVKKYFVYVPGAVPVQWLLSMRDNPSKSIGIKEIAA